MMAEVFKPARTSRFVIPTECGGSSAALSSYHEYQDLLLTAAHKPEVSQKMSLWKWIREAEGKDSKETPSTNELMMVTHWDPILHSLSGFLLTKS